MTLLKKSLGLAGVASLAVVGYAAQAARQLVVDGKASSIRVTQANGQYTVPLSDIASFFGYTMSINGDQAMLTKIPGAVVAPSSSATFGSVNGVQAVDNTPPLTSATPGTGYAYPASITDTGQSIPRTNPNPGDPMVTPPTQISVGVGKVASVDGVDYTFTSIHDVGLKYKDVYDQRQTTLQSKWKTDSLVVVNITETNQGAAPICARFPSASDITAFDGNKMGYQAMGLDLGRTTGVVSSSSSDETMIVEDPSSASTPILGPGGTINFAVIVSVPKGDSVTSVMMKVAGTTMGLQKSPDTVITMTGS